MTIRTQTWQCTAPIWSDGWVESVWNDMEYRANRGESFSAEEYLWPDRRTGVVGSVANETLDSPDHADGSPVPDSVVLDLIYAEYVVKARTNSPIDAENAIGRFPKLRDAILRQLQLDSELSHLGSDEDATFNIVETPAGMLTATPSRIGRYVVLGRLGSGGQADVFRAFHPELQSEVVIKIAKLPPDSSSSEAVRQQVAQNDQEHPATDVFRAEGRLLAQFRHPNVAQVLDFDAHDGRPFLVIEPIHGRSLDSYKKMKRLSAMEIARLMAQLSRAIDAAHQREICHLDIKPQNILVDELDRVKLIDFGLARWRRADVAGSTSSLDLGGVLRGTLGYLSPEQARMEPGAASPPADVFALGGVLYFLVTEQPPYAGKSAIEILARAQRGEWDDSLLTTSSRSPELNALVRSAMSPDPAKRPTAAELTIEFDRLANPPKSTQDASAFTRSKMVISSAVVAAAVVLGLTIGGQFEIKVPGTSDKPLSQGTEIPSLTAVGVGEGQNQPSLDSLKLNIDVWDVNRFFPLVSQVPIRSGSKLRLNSSVPAGVEVVLLARSADGKWTQLASIAAQSSVAELWYPANPQMAVPLLGVEGTEIVIACATQDPAVLIDTLRSSLGEQIELPKLSDASVLRLRPHAIQYIQHDRGFGDPVAIGATNDDVKEYLEQLKNVLQETTFAFDGFAFAHVK